MLYLCMVSIPAHGFLRLSKRFRGFCPSLHCIHMHGHKHVHHKEETFGFLFHRDAFELFFFSFMRMNWLFGEWFC